MCLWMCTAIKVETTLEKKASTKEGRRSEDEEMGCCHVFYFIHMRETFYGDSGHLRADHYCQVGDNCWSPPFKVFCVLGIRHLPRELNLPRVEYPKLC
jgi:hypothetical protein